MGEPISLVLLVGGDGFIGRRTHEALVAAGHRVVLLDRADVEALARGPSATQLRAIWSRGVPPATADDIRPIQIAALVWAAGKREPDLAANMLVHAELPLAVLRALDKPKVIYLSTGEVYGDAPLPYREDGPSLGTSDYARAKLAGEQAITSARPNEKPCAATILRLALVYGSGGRPAMLIPSTVAALRAGQHVPLTHGNQTRDLVFVDDVAQAIVRAVKAPPAGIVNIGSGVEVSVRRVCEGIADALGAPRSLLGFGEKALRPDEATRYVMDVSRARERLGWTATTSLAAGLAQL